MKTIRITTTNARLPLRSVEVRRRTILTRATAFACCLLALGLSQVSAAVTVTMTGTVETGTLNGASIDGDSFIVRAEIATGLNVDPNTVPSRGIFEVTQASMQIGAGDQFNFDASTFYYFQSHDSGNPASNFGLGFLSPLDLSGNGFFYLDRNQPDLGFPFDPTIIQPFSYSAFDDTYVSQPSTFVNGGETLSLTTLSLGGASVSAIPEPSAFGLLGLVCSGMVMLRRRRVLSK